MSNQLKMKGIWIHNYILLDTKLSDKEKFILSIILYLSNDTNCCYVSNKQLSNTLNISITQISKLVNSLKAKSYIDIFLNYKTDSKEIENRCITPIIKN